MRKEAIFLNFILGALAGLLIDHLLQSTNISKNNHTFWFPLCTGLAGAIAAFSYLALDSRLNYKPKKQDIASIFRMSGAFIGVNYAVHKLPWTSSSVVSVTLAILAITVWYLFDGSLHGFIISFVYAVIGTFAGFILATSGTYTFTQADFFGVRSWLPCILYCGCVCFGVIGRALAVDGDLKLKLKKDL